MSDLYGIKCARNSDLDGPPDWRVYTGDGETSDRAYRVARFSLVEAEEIAWRLYEEQAWGIILIGDGNHDFVIRREDHLGPNHGNSDRVDVAIGNDGHFYQYCYMADLNTAEESDALCRRAQEVEEVTVILAGGFRWRRDGEDW